MGATDDGSVSSSKFPPKPPSIASRRPSGNTANNTVVGSIDHALLQGDDPRLQTDNSNYNASASSSCTCILTGSIPAYPRRRWNLSDVHLPRRSSLWPKPVVAVQMMQQQHPMIPAATIAIRITECLQRRSIAVETNDEDATAVCSTVDGCVWTIHVWHGLLVECMPVRGSTVSFHSAALAVLRAVEGLDSGVDVRRPWQVSPLEFPRLLHMQEQYDGKVEKQELSLVRPKTETEVDTLAREGMERIRELLLHKDRYECRHSALESLICYTDASSVSPDVAHHVAHLLSTKEWSALHKHLLACVTANTDDTVDDTTSTHTTPLLRTMALHVFANLRTLLESDDNDNPSPILIDAVPNHADLLAGAARPATMTARPGPHDAALTLAASATTTSSTPVSDMHASWDKCRTVGRATHAVLALQARRLYEQTTRAAREC